MTLSNSAILCHGLLPFFLSGKQFDNMASFSWFLVAAALLVPAEVEGFIGLGSVATILDDYNPIKIVENQVFKNSESTYDDDMIVRPTKSNLKTPSVTQAKYYLHFAAAVYCNDPQLSDWSCVDCRETGPNVQLVKEINNRATNNRAIITIDNVAQEIVLTYRGTSSVKNLDQDATLEQVSIPGGNGNIKVHNGAWRNLNSLHPEVESELRSLFAKHPGYKLIIVGHSLGGFMASLAFYKLRTTPEFANLSYSLFTYGQPRTGNADYADWINQQNITAIRVVNNRDLVPHSTINAAGYVHHLRELWIQGDKEVLCSEHVYEDPTCSNSLKRYNIANHVRYWDSDLPPKDCQIHNFKSYIKNYFTRR